MNIVETIQKNLGFTKLEKIDPNTQDVKSKEKAYQTNSLGQAAIPSVICALLNYILLNRPDRSFLEQKNFVLLLTIFNDKLPKIVERVSEYAGVATTNTEQEMTFIVNETARVILENVHTAEELHQFAVHHKNEVLLYLPAVLRTGELLNNDNLDDGTNKMEGPISNLMHRIEKSFN